MNERKRCCQTLYLSCLKNCLMDRSLFVCLTVSFMKPFLSYGCSLIISHSLFSRKEVSLSFRFRWLTSEAWEVSNECDEFQSAVNRNILYANGCECRYSRCITQNSQCKWVFLQLWPILALQTFRKLSLSERSILFNLTISSSGPSCITDSFFPKKKKKS